MISIFIDREDELKLLKNNWNSGSAEFIVISGRRRIGKTRLVEHFLEGKKGIFHTSKEATKQTQINDLQRDIAAYFNDPFLKNNVINSWEGLFEYFLKIIPQKERFYLFIDEFSYLMKGDPEIIGVLQKVWDKTLSKTKIFFIICGSIMSMMQESVLSHASPLYGRRTRDLLLDELDLKNSIKFLSYPFVDKMQCYGIIGGVPSYLLVAAKYSNLKDFIINEFFNKQGFFYREPFYMLSQEFREVKTYFSILNAIALGKNTASKIANFSGIETRKIFPYLTNLIYLGFVKKETPLTVKTKYGRYYLKDKMLHFWFNFIDKNRNSIEKERYAFEEEGFRSFFGVVFEGITREMLPCLPLPFKPTQMGRWWYREEEIDIVALNENEKKILFAECKWRDDVDATRILKGLKERAKLVNWHNDVREVYYGIFAKSFREGISAKGLFLFDLKAYGNH